MNQISPEKITQPFQLLATWMIGLIFISGELIYASLQSKEILWQSVTYTISSILIILIFMRTIFVLQTKYRPEMQGGEHYQEIWRNKYGRDIQKQKITNIMEIIRNGKD